MNEKTSNVQHKTKNYQRTIDQDHFKKWQQSLAAWKQNAKTWQAVAVGRLKWSCWWRITIIKLTDKNIYHKKKNMEKYFSSLPDVMIRVVIKGFWEFSKKDFQEIGCWLWNWKLFKHLPAGAKHRVKKNKTPFVQTVRLCKAIRGPDWFVII